MCAVSLLTYILEVVGYDPVCLMFIVYDLMKNVSKTYNSVFVSTD